MRGERLKSVIKLHKRFWLLQFFLRDLLSVLKLLDSCKSTFMLVYDLEFDQIKDCLSSLNGYSDANIKLLEILLNRYEDVIQDLYAIDGEFFQSSLETFSDLEVEFHLLETEHGPVLLMKALFEDYRYRLNATINYEIDRYEHFKLIRNINYN